MYKTYIERGNTFLTEEEIKKNIKSSDLTIQEQLEDSNNVFKSLLIAEKSDVKTKLIRLWQEEAGNIYNLLIKREDNFFKSLESAGETYNNQKIDRNNFSLYTEDKFNQMFNVNSVITQIQTITKKLETQARALQAEKNSGKYNDTQLRLLLGYYEEYQKNIINILTSGNDFDNLMIKTISGKIQSKINSLNNFINDPSSQDIKWGVTSTIDYMLKPLILEFAAKKVLDYIPGMVGTLIADRTKTGWSTDVVGKIKNLNVGFSIKFNPTTLKQVKQSNLNTFFNYKTKKYNEVFSELKNNVDIKKYLSLLSLFETISPVSFEYLSQILILSSLNSKILGYNKKGRDGKVFNFFSGKNNILKEIPVFTLSSGGKIHFLTDIFAKIMSLQSNEINDFINSIASNIKYRIPYFVSKENGSEIYFNEEDKKTISNELQNRISTLVNISISYELKWNSFKGV